MPSTNPLPRDHRPAVEASLSLNKSTLEDVGQHSLLHTGKPSARRGAPAVKQDKVPTGPHPSQTRRQSLSIAQLRKERRVRVKEGYAPQVTKLHGNDTTKAKETETTQRQHQRKQKQLSVATFLHQPRSDRGKCFEKQKF